MSSGCRCPGTVQHFFSYGNDKDCKYDFNKKLYGIYKTTPSHTIPDGCGSWGCRPPVVKGCYCAGPPTNYKYGGSCSKPI